MPRICRGVQYPDILRVKRDRVWEDEVEAMKASLELETSSDIGVPPLNGASQSKIGTSVALESFGPTEQIKL